VRHPVARIRLHWWSAVLVVVAFVVGLVMVDLASGTLRVAVSLAHIALGAAVLVVTVKRLLLPASPLPPLPMEPGLRRLAEAVQGALIVAVLGALGSGALVAVGGHWLDAARGLPLTDNAVDVVIRDLHELAALMVIGLAGTHALGVLWRQWRRGDVLGRRWP
jgi:cytochrome b561